MSQDNLACLISIVVVLAIYVGAAVMALKVIGY